jgi:hydrogenase large subunit
MQLNLQVHDHLVHFYHLHALDWVDVVGAEGRPEEDLGTGAEHLQLAAVLAGLFPRHPEPAEEVRRIRPARPLHERLLGQPGLQAAAGGQPDGGAHYLEALDFQKEIVKIHTIFGGKNPHPNWLVGGVPCAINVDDTGAVGAINMERLNLVKSIIDRTIEFIEQVYIPDLLAIASFYKGWLHGGGLSSKNVMSYGDIPDKANDYSAGNLLLPRGAIINGDLDQGA